MGLESLIRRKVPKEQVEPVMASGVIVVDPNSPALVRTRSASEIIKGGEGRRDPKKLKPQLAQRDETGESLWEDGRAEELVEEARRRAEAAARLGIV